MKDVVLFPLSFAQQRLWFLDQMEPGNPFYTLPVATRLGTGLDPTHIRSALSAICDRHETLRSAIRTVGEQPYQVVLDEVPIEVPIVDLRDFEPSEQEIEVARLATIDASSPFKLDEAPLWRAKLLRLQEHEYALLFAMHHIISDGWSIRVLFHELGLFYDQARSGRPPTLPPLELQYGDYAVWQREWLVGAALEEQVDYWRHQLSDIRTLQLPTDHPRPTVQSFQGATVPITIDRQTSEALKSFCRREGTTVFVGLLAAFKTWLYRLTGEDDIVIGSPMAGRNRTEFEAMIGFFINSIVLRTNLSGAPSYQELLHRVHQTVVEAFRHQDLPFEKLVEELKPQRDLSRNPFYQVSFQLIEIPALDGSRKDSGTTAEQSKIQLPIEVDRGKALFDLDLTMIDSPEGFRGQFEFSTDLFEADTIHRFGHYFLALLKELIRSNEKPIDTLAVDSGSTRILSADDTLASQETETTHEGLHQSFIRQALKTPEATAVYHDGEQWSYADLNQISDRIASIIATHSIEPGQPIGLYLGRSMDWIASVLGILKAGGGFLPLDIDHPTPRLQAIVADSAIKLIVTTTKHAEVWSNQGIEICVIDEAPQTEPSPPAWHTDASQMAYLIYTSGSTGTPKGAVLSHVAATNHMRWMQARFPMSPEDRLLQKTPLMFDASIWEIFVPLSAGAALVLPPPNAHRDVSEMIRCITHYEITILQLVPSQLEAFLAEPGIERCTTLKRIFCGGEVLPTKLVHECHERLEVEMVNLYGPTEACIDATYWPCHENEPGEEAPIGLPIAGIEAYILDGQGNLVPPGAIGELFLGGTGLATGYWNQPELTAEKFVSSPFAEDDGITLYRTGDRVRLRHDGQIAFLGREDGQIKLRGHRIELGEIESQLRQHEQVQSCAVVVRPNGSGDRSLTAYLKPKPEPEPPTVNGSGHRPKPRQQFNGQFHRFLQQRLPAPMVPTDYVIMDQWPTLPSGKVDRSALPEPKPRINGSSTKSTTPKSDLHRVLANLWSEITDVDQVGIHDDFFADLGGHSLLATRLLIRVREWFETETPLRQIFEVPTIAGFAEALKHSVPDPAELEETAALLLQVGELSDEEVKSMLWKNTRSENGRPRTAKGFR
uniref:Nonribosomal peptide synthetase/polyketide synthase hybrid n=1 Tax=Karenia brevis TaxID=156230 RepID=D2CZD3_KARBR|nr:nonribosomal peptide synthetase/polyketide synthase hybrid [Karenia brevis]